MMMNIHSRAPPRRSRTKPRKGSMPAQAWTHVQRIIGVMRLQRHPSY